METVTQIDNITEILKDLSEPAIKEVQDFASYLREKQRKRDAFVEETLKAEREGNYIECKTVDDFISAIENADDED